jgi:hypothetical protein
MLKILLQNMKHTVGWLYELSVAPSVSGRWPRYTSTHDFQVPIRPSCNS